MDLGRTAAIILAFTLIASASVSALCYECNMPGKFVWPVWGTQLANNPVASVCDPDYYWTGHEGLDLLVSDGDPVYASFDGYIYGWINEPAGTGLYARGCGLILMSHDWTTWAVYGHLMDGGRAAVGENDIKAGDIIGRAGGGQADLNCRGDSQGPRLYYELHNLGENVDPYTCIVNTCKYTYTQWPGFLWGCVPDLLNSQKCYLFRAGEEYDWPDYSCPTPGNPDEEWEDNAYYGEATINDHGDLVLDCKGSGKYRRCTSEVYSMNVGNVWPRVKDENHQDYLNCFLRFLRVYGDGTVSCGKIQGNSVNWGAGSFSLGSAPTGECKKIAGLGIALESEVRNDEYLRLQRVTVTENPNTFNKYVVISREYKLLGVNDMEYVDLSQDLNTFNPASSIPPYWVDYVLARTCDLAGEVQSRSECKSSRIEGMEDTLMGYDELVERGGYKECEYNFIDAGKFYDDPGLYFTELVQSRSGANRGELYYI
jgi:hypothetical protein